MKKRWLSILFAASMAACSQANKAGAPPSAQAAGCAAEAQTHWAATPKSNLLIVARSEGADCASAKAVLTIANEAGKVLHTFELPVEPMRNTTFADANTPETMKAALTNWIDVESTTAMKTTAGLPEWKTGVDEPGDPEFPFMPIEGATRDGYAKIRAAKQPIYCYIQGGESENCLALDEAAGTLTSVGLQRFPG